MTMRLNSRDRLGFQSTLADTRLGGRAVSALIPSLNKSGFDEDMQSAYDVSDGDGSGGTVSWLRQQFFANVRNVETSLKTFGQVPPGAEVGDVFFSVWLRDKSLMEAVLHEPGAYFYIDGQRFRPTGILAAGVGQVEEWVVTAKEFHANQLAPGY